MRLIDRQVVGFDDWQHTRPELQKPQQLQGLAKIHDRLRGREKAERVGFEPTVPVKVHWFSRPAHSATLSPLRMCSWRAIIVIGRLERQGPLGGDFFCEIFWPTADARKRACFDTINATSSMQLAFE